MSTTVVTEGQLHILRHMLGLNDQQDRRNPEPYRDYYCANAHDVALEKLAHLGMVTRCSDGGGYWTYCTTERGRYLAMKSARLRRWPKSKRVYAKFLEISECFPDLTFGEFLKADQFADCRRNA